MRGIALGGGHSKFDEHDRNTNEEGTLIRGQTNDQTADHHKEYENLIDLVHLRKYGFILKICGC